MIQFDYSKLRGRIREVFGTQAKFANEMKITTATLSSKLNNAVEFKQGEMDRACDLLTIGASEIKDYFFTEKVQ